MPTFLSPHRIIAHRTAAIALYRALLTQSRRAPLPLSSRNELANLIRYRFKQWRNQQSTKRLRIAFRGAYEALDKLDAAIAGDGTSTTYIESILGRVAARYKQPYPRVPSKQTTVQAFIGPRRSILDRPRPLSELSGRRHVPRIINASKVPVLRIKKPQPASLSAYITSRRRKSQMRTNVKQRLEREMELAKTEDVWDELIDSSSTQLSARSREPRWTSAAAEARGLVTAHIDAEQRKNAAMAEQMQGIVEAERQLAKQESRARRRAARKANRGKSDGTAVPIVDDPPNAGDASSLVDSR